MGECLAMENMIQEEDKCRNSQKEMMIREETFLKQRLKVLWLKVGDRNIAYFHRSALIHKRRNTIDIKDGNNVNLSKLDQIGNYVTSYFKNYYLEEWRNIREQDR